MVNRICEIRLRFAGRIIKISEKGFCFQPRGKKLEFFFFFFAVLNDLLIYCIYTQNDKGRNGFATLGP